MTIYKWGITLILMAIGVAARGEVTTVFEAREADRAWLAANYPRPDTLSRERLLEEAGCAVDIDMQGPEVERLLEAAAKFVPEVGEYLAWIGLRDYDTLNVRHRNALRGLAREAGKIESDGYTHRDLLTTQFFTDAIYRDRPQQQIASLDSLIDRQKATVSATHRKKDRELLTVMELTSLMAKIGEDGYCDMRRYADIWRLERDVFELFPLESEEVSRNRIQAYSFLAELKSYPEDAQDITCNIPPDYDYNRAEEMYSYQGGSFFCTYYSNSLYLYQKVGDLSEKLYGEFGTMTLHSRMSCLEYIASTGSMNEDGRRDASTIASLVDLAYPTRSAIAERSRLLKLRADNLVNYDLTVLEKKESLLDNCHVIYGYPSPTFMSAWGFLVDIGVIFRGDFDEMEIYTDALSEAFPDNPLMRLYYKYFRYSNVAMVDAAKGMDLMLGLVAEYEKINDRGSGLSLTIGKALYNYFLTRTGRLDVAAELQQLAMLGAKAIYGRESAQYYLERSHLLITQCSMKPEKSKIGSIDKLISEVSGLPEKTGGMITRELAMLKTRLCVALDDIEGAVSVARQELEYDKEDYGLMALLAQMEIQSGKRSAETDALLDNALKVIEGKDDFSLDAQRLLALADGLAKSNRPTDAIRVLETAQRVHDLQTDMADEAYYEIRSALATLYDYTENIAGAAKIRNEDQYNIVNSRWLNPSDAMFQYLVACGSRALSRWDTSGFFYLQTALKIVNDMDPTQSDLSRIQHIYLPSVIKEILLAMARYSNALESGGEAILAEEQKNQWETNRETFGEQCKPVLDDLLETFPSYNPDYKKDPNYLMTVYSMALYYRTFEKDWDKTIEYVKETLDLTENQSDRRALLNDLGFLYDKAGDKAESERYYALAVEELSSAEIATAPERIMAENYKAMKAKENGRLDEALEHARNSYGQKRKILDSNFQLMSEMEQNAFMNTYGDPAFPLTALLEHDAARLAPEVYDAVVYRTGLQLRSQQELGRIISGSDDEVLRHWADSLTAAKAALNRLAMPENGTFVYGQTPDPENAKLQLTVQRLEQEILDYTAEKRMSHPDITWQQIRDRLRPGEAAVEYLFSETRIMALVLTPGCTAPEAVPLCKGDSLVSQLSSWGVRNTAALARHLYDSREVDLYSMLWSPIEPILARTATKRVYLTTPGVLHTLAFNAFATPDGGYLMDRYELRNLTTTAQLVFDQEDSAPRSAALIGDVIFADSQRALAGIIPEETGVRSVDDTFSVDDFGEEDDGERGLKKAHFKYLPFTGLEVSELQGIMKEISPTAKVRDEATESSFREFEGKSPEVLHLATHGFYLASGKDAVNVPYMKRFGTHIYSPMLRSGVALAGAEKAWCGTDLPGDNDGILTAEEVSRLDLNGTSLVALSACETALGDYSFEGVFGLTRGFKQAGVRSLLVSLWSVNDASTALFMTEFYRNWMATGDRHGAYCAAMAEVRAKYPSPFNWAPFVLLD